MTLPRFHPDTVIRELGPGEKPFTIADATCHVGVLGATGSGKTSGSGMFFRDGLSRKRSRDGNGHPLLETDRKGAMG